MRRIILLGLFVILLMSLVSADGYIECQPTTEDPIEFITLTGDYYPIASTGLGEKHTSCNLYVLAGSFDNIIEAFNQNDADGITILTQITDYQLDITISTDGSLMLEVVGSNYATKFAKVGGYDITLPQNTRLTLSTYDEESPVVLVGMPGESALFLDDFWLSSTSNKPARDYYHDFAFGKYNNPGSDDVVDAIFFNLDTDDIILNVNPEVVSEDEVIELVVNSHHFKYSGQTNSIQRDGDYLVYTIADTDEEACNRDNSPGSDDSGMIYFAGAYYSERQDWYKIHASMCDTEIRFKNKLGAFYGEFELKSNADNNEIQFTPPYIGDSVSAATKLFTLSGEDELTIDRDDTTQESGEGDASYHFEGTVVVNKDSSTRKRLSICGTNLNQMPSTTLGKGTDIEFKLTKTEGEDWECNIEQCLFKSNSKEENVADGYLLICDDDYPKFEIFDTDILRDVDHLESDINTEGYREWDCDALDCMESSFNFEPSTLQGPHNFGDTKGGTYKIWLNEDTVVESIGGGGAPYLLLKEDDENFLVHANVFTVGHARFMPNGNDAYITTDSRGDALAAFNEKGVSPVETETTTAFWRVAGNFFLTGFAVGDSCKDWGVSGGECGQGSVCNMGDCVADADRDGVPTDIDKCPRQTGEKLHFGCNDIYEYYNGDGEDDLGDDDGDGWLNFDDDCPDVAEDFDNYDDFDGCPEDEGAEPEEDFDGLVQDDDDMIDYEDEDGEASENVCDKSVDADCDGLLDVEDLCAELPERSEDYGTYDGCPDNDKDGVAGAADECEHQKGYTNNGCPADNGDPGVETDREIVEPVEQQVSDSGSGGGADIMGVAGGLISPLTAVLGGGGTTTDGTVAEEEELKTGACMEEEKGDFACSSEVQPVKCTNLGGSYTWKADHVCASDKQCKSSSCGDFAPLDCCVDKDEEEDSDGVADDDEDDADADVLSSSDEAELVTEEPKSLTTAYSNNGPVVSLTGGYAYNQKTGFKYALQRGGDYAFYVDQGSANYDMLAVIDCCTLRPRPHSLSSNSEDVTGVKLVGCEKKGDRWDKVVENEGINSALKLSSKNTCEVDAEVADEDNPKIDDGDGNVEEGEEEDVEDKLNEGCKEYNSDWSCQCLMSAHGGPWEPSLCTDDNNCKIGLCPGKNYCCENPTLKGEKDDILSTECNDGIDNDGDGLVDYGSDLGCVSEGDESELDGTVSDSRYTCGDCYDIPGSITYDVCSFQNPLNYWFSVSEIEFTYIITAGTCEAINAHDETTRIQGDGWNSDELQSWCNAHRGDLYCPNHDLCFDVISSCTDAENNDFCWGNDDYLYQRLGTTEWGQVMLGPGYKTYQLLGTFGEIGDPGGDVGANKGTTKTIYNALCP